MQGKRKGVGFKLASTTRGIELIDAYLCTFPTEFELLEQQLEVCVGQICRCRSPSRNTHCPGHLAGPNRCRDEFERGRCTTHRLPVHKRRPNCQATRGKLRVAPILVRVIFTDIWCIRIRCIKSVEQRDNVIGRFARFEIGGLLQGAEEIRSGEELREFVGYNFYITLLVVFDLRKRGRHTD